MASNCGGLNDSSSSNIVSSKRKVTNSTKTSSLLQTLTESTAPTPTPTKATGSNSPVEGNTSAEPTSKKSRSEVWEHYEKLKDANGNETGKAKCIWCDKIYQCKSEQGTSGLWKHLRESCKKCPVKKDLVEAYKGKDKNQKILSFQAANDSGEGKLSCWQFDQEAVRAALVEAL